MLRKLLACLALLTGLAAAGTPAQAQVAAALASRVEASAGVEMATQAQAEADGREKRPARAVGDCACPRRSTATISADTVRIGSDRARE